MFGFGNRNKNKEADTELEMITMQAALGGASLEEFFGKSPSAKNELPHEQAPEIKIPKQLEEQAKETVSSIFKKPSTAQKKQTETPRVNSSPFLGAEDAQLSHPDTINQRTIKPQKIQIPLEKKVPKEKGQDLEKKQEFLLDKILRKQKSPEQAIQAHKLPKKQTNPESETSIGAAPPIEPLPKKKLLFDALLENAPLPQKASFADKPAQKKRASLQEKTSNEKTSQENSARKQESPGYEITDKNIPLKRRLSIDEILERETSPKQELLINKLLKKQNTGEDNSPIAKKRSPSPFAEPNNTENKQIAQTKKKRFDISNNEEKAPFNQRSKPILNEIPQKEQSEGESFYPLQNAPQLQQRGSLSSELETRNTQKETAAQEESISQPQIKLDSRIHPEKKYSKLLLFIAFLLILSTIASGAYYYLFVIKQTQSGWSPIKLPSILEQNNKTQQNRKIIADVLGSSTTRSLSEATFKQDFEKLVVALKSDTKRNQELEKGIFLKLFSEKNAPYSSKEILSLFEIESEAINTVITDNTWCFLASEKSNSSQKENLPVKLSIFMELREDMQSSQIVSIVMESEENMPQQFLPLFIDEEKPVVPRIVSFERSFTQNEIAPQTRYFNYEKGVAAKSIDWSVVSDQNKSYLMISTSKSSTEKIINQLQ